MAVLSVATTVRLHFLLSKPLILTSNVSDPDIKNSSHTCPLSDILPFAYQPLPSPPTYFQQPFTVSIYTRSIPRNRLSPNNLFMLIANARSLYLHNLARITAHYDLFLLFDAGFDLSLRYIHPSSFELMPVYKIHDMASGRRKAEQISLKIWHNTRDWLIGVPGRRRCIGEWRAYAR